MMLRSIFITGTSSGLGNGFARCYLEKQWQVYGISRRISDEFIANPNFHFQSLDLTEFDRIPTVLDKLLLHEQRIDVVILNAGVIGTIGDLIETDIPELKQVMDINLWANKIILDYLLKDRFKPDQIILISSGAAVNGNRGWGGYSLSKAALNMLAKLYAQEFPQLHFTALAPGLVDTPMQDYLCECADETRFPSVKVLKAARNTPAMPKPEDAARTIISLFPKLLSYESGSFVDIRKI